MAEVGASETAVRPARHPLTSSAWVRAAGVLLLNSAAVQLAASIERWVVLAASWDRTDMSIEDHRFDYSYPTDPWQNLGSTAQLYGAGILLLSLALLAASRAAPGRDTAVQRVVVVLVAVALGASGAHALLSGVTGAPSPMQFPPLLSLLSLIGSGGLVVLACRWLRASWPASVACLLLLGSTMPGYLVATFFIAPIIAGYQSHDTTPWTEAVGAVATGAAGVVLLLAAGRTVRR